MGKINADNVTDYKYRDVTNKILGCAFEVQNNLGCGFLEGKIVDPFSTPTRHWTSDVGHNQLHLSRIKYVALDQKYITQKRFQELYKEAKKVKSLIGGFIKYLKKPRPRT